MAPFVQTDPVGLVQTDIGIVSNAYVILFSRAENAVTVIAYNFVVFYYSKVANN